VPAVIVKPLVSVTTSVPVVMVTFLRAQRSCWIDVQHCDRTCGRVHPLVNTTVIPAPKLAVVVPCTKFVYWQVMDTLRFCCPWKPRFGFATSMAAAD